MLSSASLFLWAIMTSINVCVIIVANMIVRGQWREASICLRGEGCGELNVWSGHWLCPALLTFYVLLQIYGHEASAIGSALVRSYFASFLCLITNVWHII